MKKRNPGTILRPYVVSGTLLSEPCSPKFALKPRSPSESSTVESLNLRVEHVGLTHGVVLRVLHDMTGMKYVVLVLHVQFLDPTFESEKEKTTRTNNRSIRQMFYLARQVQQTCGVT